MNERKELFFARMEELELALTFNDVRIMTGPSDYAANEVDITTRFSTNVDLKIPMVSAAMDTVTESKMAIAMAKLGGLGVIHAGLDPEAQKKEARRVKLHLNGLIATPITFTEDRSLESILSECEQRQLDFRTFPITNTDNKFVGLLTQNDFDLGSGAMSAKDFMTPLDEVVVAGPETSINQAYDVMKKEKKKTLPLIDKDGSVAGLYILSDVQRIVGESHGLYNQDSEGRLIVAAAVPTDEEAVARVEEMKDYLDVAVIDSAQGDSKFAFATLKQLKEEFPGLDVVVGNISSGVSAKMLAERGADGIKVGQGPGSICTTRIETGIGTPQVTAVYECVKAIRDAGFDVPVCADGGIVNSGDIPIAIAAGASSVMMGGRLAGTDESPGEVTELAKGKRVKMYRGMGSAGALRDSAAARKRYGQEDKALMLTEGVEGNVPYKGEVALVVGKDVLALRKGMSYAGTKDIEDHQNNALFKRPTQAGMLESHPHDIDQSG